MIIFRKLFNVLIIVLSFIYTLTALVLFYESSNPSFAFSFALGVEDIKKFYYFEVLQFVMLLGSIIYYHYSRQFWMRLIASVGSISMIVVFVRMVFL